MPEWQTTVRWKLSVLFSYHVISATYANDALGADQLDELVGDAALGVALGVRLDVAEVTNVTGLVRGSTVGLVVGVDCRALGQYGTTPQNGDRDRNAQ